MSRWSDINKTMAHLGMSLAQDTGGFKFAAATVSSFLLVMLRCQVSGNSARQAVGTPQEDYTRTAAGQTVFREWGAFLTSYGIVNVLNAGLSKASEVVLNARETTVDRLSVGQAARQLVGITFGQVKDLPTPPKVLTGETLLEVGKGGFRVQPFLQWLGRQGTPAVVVGESAEALAQRGFRRWMAFGPITAASAVGVGLSGWMLERLALKKGPQLIAYLIQGSGSEPKAPQPAIPSPQALNVMSAAAFAPVVSAQAGASFHSPAQASFALKSPMSPPLWGTASL